MPKQQRLRTAYDATVTPGHARKLLPALAKQFGAGASVTSYLMHRDGQLVAAVAKGRKRPAGHRVRIVVMVPE